MDRKGIRKVGQMVTSQPAMTIAKPMRLAKQGQVVSGFPLSFGVGAGTKSRAKPAAKPKSRTKMY